MNPTQNPALAPALPSSPPNPALALALSSSNSSPIDPHYQALIDAEIASGACAAFRPDTPNGVIKDVDDAFRAGLLKSADDVRAHVISYEEYAARVGLPIHPPAASAPPLYAPAASGAPPALPDLSACLVTAAELESLQLPRRPRLLGAWLCQADLGYIFAPRGVGKTWLAMALPAALSQRRALGLWKEGETASNVLYVDGEMPLELTQYRSRGLDLGAGAVTYLHHETLFEMLGSSINIGLAHHREALTRLIVEHGFTCLILDNLSALASGVDENKGADYEPIGHWLLELRRRKITVIVIHHAGRNGFMRGHSKREDACSWIIELRDAKGQDDRGARFLSHFAKPSRNTGEPVPDLLWQFTSDENGAVSVGCQLYLENEYEQFIKHVLDGVTAQRDIVELMDKPRGTVSKWVTKALKEGRISGKPKCLLPPDAEPAWSANDEEEDEDTADWSDE